MKSIRNDLYPSKAKFLRFSHWIWWGMSPEQSKPFSDGFLIGFNKEWAVSIQSHILVDFVLKSIEMSYIHPRLDSHCFHIEFDERWALSSQSSFPFEFLLDLIRNELSPFKATFSGILCWSQYEMNNIQQRLGSYISIEFDEEWTLRSQSSFPIDFSLDLLRNDLYSVKAIFLRISCWSQ